MRIKHVYCNLSFRTCVKSKQVEPTKQIKMITVHFSVYNKLGPTLLIESKIF